MVLSASVSTPNWSGVVAPTNGTDVIQAEWYAPVALAPTNGAQTAESSNWIGQGGVQASGKATSLIQIGTHEIVNKGQVTYGAFWEIVGKQGDASTNGEQTIKNLVVQPGDLISAQITPVQTKKGAKVSDYTMVITDQTQSLLASTAGAKANETFKVTVSNTKHVGLTADFIGIEADTIGKVISALPVLSPVMFTQADVGATAVGNVPGAQINNLNGPNGQSAQVVALANDTFVDAWMSS
jgi:hypothetical protein